MTELLHRMLDAIPQVDRWIDELHERYSGQAHPTSEMGFPRLPAYLPSSLLLATRFACVDIVPFPPVSSFGVPEFQSMAQMPMAGITFRDMYFVQPAHATEGIHFHELIHVVQWRVLGVRSFLLTYALGILQHGYEASPLEAIAFDYQRRFERNVTMSAVVDDVTRHAVRSCHDAAAQYRTHGINLDASAG
jgi:hypothetical protein